MDKLQAEVEKQILENEKQVLEELKNNYTKALKEIKQRIKELQSSEITQSKIYQIQYQQNLEKQLTALIDVLSNDNINSINEYLAKTYKDGFIGTQYHMQSEGVPFIMPLDQESIVKSIQKKTEDMKLSQRLYKNANELKKNIKAEITRGLSQALTYSKIARNISLYSEADMNKAYRIARTEGGRVQSEAKFEAMKKAKDNGADVVKQWDSTLDDRTRETHARLDGQIQEIDETFKIDGKEAMYPHGFGIAEEDINCRCVVLERARSAVKDEGKFTKIVDGNLVEFKDVKSYNDFKEKYFDFYEKQNMAPEENKGAEKLILIGKLDKNKLGKYKNRILTENVILTTERIEHIKEHHPGDYEKYGDYITEIINEPDYVLNDNKNIDTVLFMKTIDIEDKNIQLVIRLNTNKNESDKQNSILTLWKVKNKTYKQMIRNKEILWQKLDKDE